MITPQVKRVVDALLAAGFKRSDFRAECPVYHRGTKREYYGQTRVTLLCLTARSIDLTPAVLAQGLGVEHIVAHGEIKYVGILTGPEDAGQLRTLDVSHHYGAQVVA